MFDAWKQRQRQRLENRPERTVFYNIFATMMLVLAVELLMSAASILAVNVTGQLDENAKDLLTMRVRNRASYVQEILRNAEDLEQLSEQITATTQQLLKSGDISLDTLDNGSEQSDALLVALAPQLLDTLRTKQVTGIFLILNTHDLDTCEVGKKMPGIYLRDMDPDARPSERNSDLLLERASATVVKELAIGTDKGWQPAFPYQGDTKGGILRTVFQTAYKGDAGLSAESYGRWTTNSYCLAGDDRHAIAYSMPLILPDGTVYGVVGVELLTEYLQTKLPFTELDEDKAGTYFIVTTTDDALTDGVLSLRKTVTSGEDLVTADAPLGVLNCRSNGNGGNWVELNDKRYYMVLEPLQVYNRNAPFAAEKWFLAGTMEQSVLLAFSSRVREVLLTTIAITLVLSVLGSLLVSARLARPINRLYREVIDAQEKKTFPRLSRTAIREVDRFAETITELNKELVTNYQTLLDAEAAYAKLVAELGKKADTIYKNTGDYLAKRGTPSVGSIGGEWMALGLARSGRTVPEGYYDAVVKYVKDNIDSNGRLDKNKATENARIILALTAIGKDVTNVDGHDLLAGLNEMSYLSKQGINGAIFTLIALDSHSYTPAGDVTRDKLVQAILDAQISGDGGWSLDGKNADVDMTAMAIQALAAYYKSNSSAKKAVDKGLSWLSSVQQNDGGFTSWGAANSESCAQVIVALTALGINPAKDSRFIKNGASVLDALCSFAVDGGGFKHLATETSANGMATEQGFYALVAYYRLLNGQSSLYDMADVKLEGVKTEESVNDADKPDDATNTDTPVDTEVEDTSSGGQVVLWVVIGAVAVGGITALAVTSKKRHGRGAE